MNAPKLTERVSKLPEYWPWVAMINRCNNPQNISFPKYGAKGIKVVVQWCGREGFLHFRAHIGPRPSKKHSIDRIDNARGYEPGNVRWATNAEQHRNRTDNDLITFKGETLCAADWAAKLGISRQSMQKRLREWPLEKALTSKRRNYTAPAVPQRLGPMSKCMCGHTGDGPNSEHAPRFAEGHGPCKQPGCKSRQFTWMSWLTDAGRAVLKEGAS